MYTKGNAGTYFQTFISPRDICYMHSRFKRTLQFEDNSYNIVGSLDYSIDKNNPYYVKHYNSEYTRAIIKYRSYLLIKQNNSKDVKLVYISCFNADPNGNIPQLIIWQYVKHKALNMIHKFINSWDNKINVLKNKRKLLHCENQEWKMGLLYCINSLLPKQIFTSKMFDNICYNISQNKFINSQKSILILFTIWYISINYSVVWFMDCLYYISEIGLTEKYHFGS